ncbi:MAG: hypothetical protein V1834_04830 [Candidatus Micrarchaeota archaeon]
MLMSFKCGIEIHQRLDTRKLFCDCYYNAESSGETKAGIVLRRKIKSVASELGELDVAANYEARMDKSFEYVVDPRFSCCVESDEEPPHELNKDALEVALGIALALNCTPVEEIHVMRKSVADGSAVSGFQRTALIATGGFIETSKGRVGVQSVCLEEEASGIIEKTKEKDVYRLDRLGIPLVEIATAPDVKDGEHAQEAAAAIGGLLRGARVQRGIGTIRQDVNVSVDGGERVEVKGVQDLRLMPKLVDEEVRRQLKEGVRKGGETRRAVGEKTEYMRPLPGAARMYPETDVVPVVVDAALLQRAHEAKPRAVGEKKKELAELGLNPELVKKLSGSRDEALFAELVEATGADANFVATVLLDVVPSLKRDGLKAEALSRGVLAEVLALYSDGVLVKAAVKEVLKGVCEGKQVTALARGLKRITGADLKKKVADYKKKHGERAFAEMIKDNRLRVDANEAKQLFKAV